MKKLIQMTQFYYPELKILPNLNKEIFPVRTEYKNHRYDSTGPEEISDIASQIDAAYRRRSALCALGWHQLARWLALHEKRELGFEPTYGEALAYRMLPTHIVDLLETGLAQTTSNL